jgi:hypothetical protein
MTDKRKAIQDLIDGVMTRIDPTGTNAQKYRRMFQTMNDTQFTSWINAFLKDPKANLRLDIEEFGKVQMKYENIEKAAEFLKIPIYEYVYMPHISSDPNRPVRTKQPVMVGYLNIKRPQQLVSKKTGIVLDDTDRDEITGAVKGKSKGGTTSGIEAELLCGVGADEVISEICGVRGDNIQEYDAMISQIAETGSARLEDIKTSSYDKPTVLKADIFLRAMGFKTDMVSEAYYSIDRMRKSLKREAKV